MTRSMFSRLLAGAAALGLLAATTLSSIAADAPLGDWKIAITSPEGQEFHPTLRLTKAGDKLGGVFIGDDGAETACKEVKLDGNKLMVSVARDFGGQELGLKFDGTVSGDKVSGTVEYDLGGNVGNLEFTGEKAGAAAAGSAGGVDLSGKWNVVASMADGQTFEPSLTLEQKGDTASGEFIWIDGMATKIDNVKISGDKLDFVVNIDFGGQTLKVTFTGKIENANKVVGSAEYDLEGQTGTVEYVATRAADLSGKWNMVASTPDGQTFEPTLELKHSGSAIGGEYVWIDGSKVKIENGKLDGDKLTFNVNVDFGGQTLKVAFNGKVDGEKLKGTADYDLDGQTGSVDFEAARDKPKAADIAGLWNAVATTPDGQSFEPSVKITQDGDKIGGEFIWIDGMTAPISTGKISGNDVNFEVSVDFGGQALVIKFAGKLEGEKMKGSAEYDLGGATGTVEFKATRAKDGPKVAGAWNFTLSMNGNDIETSLNLKDDAGKLSGKYTGPAGEADAKDLKVDGNKLSFTVTRDREGQELKMTYRGTVEGDSIKGDVDFDFGDQAGTATFTGKRAN